MVKLRNEVHIELNGNNITDHVVEYTRTQQICNGIGTLELSVPKSSGLDFDPWDIIEIWEYDDKIGKFYVSESKESARNGTILVGADDGSKLITDYFLTETHQSDVLTYSRYWIERILDEATVNYQFTVGDDQGGPVNPNTSFGLDSAYNLIQGLLQQSGWYLFFNPDGIAIIGRIDRGLNDPDHTISNSEILDFNRERDDARLRNRAVVWGNANPLIGEQVFVDITMPSPYQIDSDDERTVVLANSSIYSNSVGVDLAYKMLNEFKDIKDVKTILVESNKNFEIGNVIRVNSEYWTGSGLLTTLEASMGKNGLVHTLTINEKCPRLFAYFGLPLIPISGFYVYVGTEGDGVWKKYTEGSTWYDTSSGLDTDLNIVDLFIKDDIHACVTSNGFLYTKTSDLAPWSRYDHPELRDRDGVSYPASGIKARACSINDVGHIVAGYDSVTLSGELLPIPIGRAWVLEVSPTHQLIKAEQVAISGVAGYITNLGITDIEAAGEYNIVSVSGVAASGYIMEAITWYRQHGVGYRDIQLEDLDTYFFGTNSINHGVLPADSKALNVGWGRGTVNSMVAISGSATKYRSTPICIQNTLDYWYVAYDRVVRLSPSTVTATTWMFSPIPAEFNSNPDIETADALFLQKKDSNTFHIVYTAWENTGGVDEIKRAFHIYHYEWTIGDLTPTLVNDEIIAETDYEADDELYMYGHGVIGDKYVVGYYYRAEGAELGSIFVDKYDLTTHLISSAEWLTDGEFADADFPDWEVRNLSVISTGDRICFVVTVEAGADPKYFPLPVLLPVGWQAQRINSYIATYSVDEFGLSHTATQQLSTLAATHENSFFVFYAPYGETYHHGYCVDTLTDDAYFMLTTQYRQQTGVFYSGPDPLNWAETWGIKIPALSQFFYQVQGPYTENVSPAESFDFQRDNIPYWGGEGFSFSLVSAGGTVSKFEGPYFFVRSSPTPFDPDLVHYQIRRNTWDTILDDVTGSDDLVIESWGNTRNGDDLTDTIIGQVSEEGSLDYLQSVDPYDITTAVAKWRMFYVNFTTTELSQNFLLRSGTGWALFIPGELIINSVGNKGNILKHTTAEALGITASDEAEIQSWGNFDLILETPSPAKVEISKGSPTVAYTLPSGILPYPDSFFAATTSNGYGTWYSHVDTFPTYDARVVDLLDPAAFPVVSGVFDPEDFQRFITFATPNGWAFSNYQFGSDWTYIASGLVNHIESSNYTPYGPYLFYSVSGVGIGRFNQKSPISSVWYDFSSTLPASEITIIRCDDQF